LSAATAEMIAEVIASTHVVSMSGARRPYGVVQPVSMKIEGIGH
jgi:hypothetical protein